MRGRVITRIRAFLGTAWVPTVPIGRVRGRIFARRWCPLRATCGRVHRIAMRSLLSLVLFLLCPLASFLCLKLVA
jgi:hypothetical protein